MDDLSKKPYENSSCTVWYKRNEELSTSSYLNHLGINQNVITKESNFANDLGADSLDTVELVMAIEEEFQIEIPDEEADQIANVQQAVDFILNKATVKQ